jgi:hypothetical protein
VGQVHHLKPEEAGMGLSPRCQRDLTRSLTKAARCGTCRPDPACRSHPERAKPVANPVRVKLPEGVHHQPGQRLGRRFPRPEIKDEATVRCLERFNIHDLCIKGQAPSLLTAILSGPKHNCGQRRGSDN